MAVWVRILTIIILFLSFLEPAALARAEDGPLKRARFLPQWSPQAQFAGYYVAFHKDIYKQHGIDLYIQNGGPGHSPREYLEKGKTDFTTLWLATGIQMRAQGVLVVNMAQILQRSALMLVAKKARGIETVADIDGHKVGLWGSIFQVQPMAFFRKFNLQVTVVPQSRSLDLFLRDGVAVASAMWYNEYHTILISGIDADELTAFFFHDYGLNYPEDGLYALESTWREDPTLCQAFIQASLEGWRHAFDHPEEAVDIVMTEMERAHIPATRVHQRWMLDRMKDLMIPADDPDRAPGLLIPADYERVAQGLQALDLIDGVPDFSSFYRACSHD